jgi:hypothetical protein
MKNAVYTDVGVAGAAAALVPNFVKVIEPHTLTDEGVPTYCETQAELLFGTYNYYILHSHVALVDAGITVPKKSDLILVLHADWDDAMKFPDGP